MLHPERAPAQLSTLEERCAKFARLGADYALVRHFTLDVAHEDAREYLASLVKKYSAPSPWWWAKTTALATTGQGDARLIGEMSAHMDFAAVIVPPVYEQGELGLLHAHSAACSGKGRPRGAQKLLDIDAAL